jgi:hypothetical protein
MVPYEGPKHKAPGVDRRRESALLPAYLVSSVTKKTKVVQYIPLFGAITRTRGASLQVRQKQKANNLRRKESGLALCGLDRIQASLNLVVQKHSLKPPAAQCASQEAVNRHQIVARNSTTVKARFLAYNGRTGP